jgi:translation initiation factor 4E
MATPASALPQGALQANTSTLAAALSEVNKNGQTQDTTDNGVDLEDGEIQELDMEQHADDIRTVFGDPTNFNVKVSLLASQVGAWPLTLTLVLPY